jgi:hypothetical protein
MDWAAGCRDAFGRSRSIRVLSADGIVVLIIPAGEIAYCTPAQARQLHTAIRRAANIRRIGTTRSVGIALSLRADASAARRRPDGISSPRVPMGAAWFPGSGEAGPAPPPGLTAPHPTQQE